MRKALLAAAFAAMAGAAFAQTDGPGPNLVIDVAGSGANGQVVIDLFPDVAPKHVAQIVQLAQAGEYDDVVFHRVIDGFMAQTGDVEFGKGAVTRQSGMGGSDLPDLPAEFSDKAFQRGTVGMARSQSPNSANSQFFIMFAPGDFLNGQYTVVGQVIEGMDVVDAITRGEPPADADRMVKVAVQQ
ncbi:peptidylprolyl isomerase [Falsirhodobacter halotolerans]|uniref:peptidylprolyl isomerase n=1 Tax=Falsirhodobacter halotolerans TaxID=1146892 RepID=UPI001FD16F8B|nr:peptidylprolyl isomerase [Falsirhodobacter halotolerans]MCJ8139227.1 peptidylprolyl isomerase [Falsirhodobacter halotolerans]